MIKTIFLGLAGIMSIVLFACIASYYKEIIDRLHKKLSIGRVKNTDECQFDDEEEPFAYVEYDRKSIYEESEYEESKPVCSSQTQPSII